MTSGSTGSCPRWTAKLFEGLWYIGIPGRTYDVSPDGRRFLLIKEALDPQQGGLPTITIVVNWFEELKARVPAD